MNPTDCAIIPLEEKVMKRLSLVAISCLVLATLAPRADAGLATINFNAITKHNNSNAQTGKNQFTIDVSDSAGAGKIVFKFKNTGNVKSTITDIFFDDGPLHSTLASLVTNPISTSASKVKFSIGSSYTNLPDAASASPGFQGMQAFSCTADNPALTKGVNKNDWVSVTFNLKSGKGLQNVLDDISTGALRLGVYGQQIGDTSPSNESYVSVPEPATIAVLGFGGLCLSRTKRRG
jgi:hypothetical protein